MRYKWEQWNTVTETQMVENTVGPGVVYSNDYNDTDGPTLYWGLGANTTSWLYYPATNNSITYKTDGKWKWLELKKTSPKYDYNTNSNTSLNVPANHYFCACRQPGIGSINKFKLMFYTKDGVNVTTYTSSSSYAGEINGYGTVKYSIEDVAVKGSQKLGEYFSSNINKYPADGAQLYGNTQMWYTRVGSDSITPDSVVILGNPHVAGNVKIKITPSTDLKFGGTITYTISTTVDGSKWAEALKTTETEAILYVPGTATKWGVRVKASDDNGVVDDAYVYGNGVTTVTPETADFIPYSGNIGYAVSKHILNVTIDSTSSFALTATINGATVYSGTGVNGTNAITISDSAFTGLPENEPIEMTVKAELSSGTVTRVYTFRKFSYNRTSLSGVFTGAAKALRNQTGDSKQILGANIPEEIMKLPAYKLAETTATPETVFAGRTFIDRTGEVKAGRGLANVTTATAKDIPGGLTAYNYLGELLTGTADNVRVQVGYIPNAGKGAVSGSNKVHNIYYKDTSLGKPHMIIAWFDTWGPYNVSHSANVRDYSFSPYLVAGSITGQLFQTTGGNPSGSYTFRNQNQTGANSTMSVYTNYTSFIVSYLDYASGEDLCYIFLW